jgi:hypothetical protein
MVRWAVKPSSSSGTIPLSADSMPSLSSLSSLEPSSTPIQITRGLLGDGKAPSPLSEMSNGGCLTALRASLILATRSSSTSPMNLSVRCRFPSSTGFILRTDSRLLVTLL